MSRTASTLIVGNEVLSGKVRDTNGPYLIDRLRQLGVELRRILVVQDDVEAIAEAVRDLRGRTDWVFTSGGIGPTHDDVTVRGVAEGLGRKVVRDERLVELVKRHYAHRLTSEALRLADVPEGSTLVEAPGMWVPTVEVEHFYLLPGVPQLFRRLFDAMAERFKGEPFHLRSIYVSAHETDIAATLDRHVAAHPNICVGSYPRFDAPDYQVRLTVEGRDCAEVERAFEELKAALPPGTVVRTD